MPRKSRKLRLLILATLASSGASTSFVVQAGPTAWSCQADPVSGSWNCTQTGDTESAKTAVRMSQRAAGNPKPSDAQVDIATSKPNSVVPAASESLSKTMAEARRTAERSMSDDSAEATAEATPDTHVTPPASARVVEPKQVRPAAKPAPIQAGVENKVIGLKPAPQAPAQPATPPAPPPPSRPEPAPPVEKNDKASSMTSAPDADVAAAETDTATAEPANAETNASTTASAPPAGTSEDEYALARRVGQLSDADIAALREAQTNLNRGEAAPIAMQSKALARLQSLADETAATADTTDEHAPADWPEAQFADQEIASPVHIAYEAIETYPQIDQRRAWTLCGANSDPSMTQDIPVHAAPNREGLPTFAIADDVQGKRRQYYTLFGDAELRRGDQRLQGDIIHYDATTERADAEGNVRYREAGLAMDSDWGYLVMANDTGEFGRSRFYLPERHGRGTAEHMDIESRTLSRGQTTTYTTCNYGVDTWYLDSEEVELDREEGVGTARNAWIKLLGMPIAYTPWISFPLDDRRKSGLLTPSYGSSDINGTKLSIPYYWNIAPDRDATFTPYLYSKRGVRVDTEFRYLNPSSHGLVEVDVLPSDNVYGKDRGLFHWEHTATLSDNLDFELYGSHVSDPYYLKDFENTLFNEDTTTLPRYMRFTYTPEDWVVSARLHEDYLVNKVPKASRPYRRLPEITASTSHFDADSGLDLSFTSRAIYFQNAARVEAGRLELKPRLRYPMRTSYGHITPEVELNHTQWHLGSGNAGSNGLHQYLTVPTFALDSEIYFEKAYEYGGQNYLHSIEPRVRYTFTPNTDQSTRPLFDASRNDISYSTLFLNNRFGGGDRYGDANQIAVGVTNRLMRTDYSDLLRLSMGELFYLDDRHVTIGAATDLDRKPNSDFVAELFAQLPFGLSATANLRWDHKKNETPDHNWQLSYSKSAEDFVSYSYTHRRNVSRESNLNFAWSLSPQWHVIGQYEYDHLSNSNVTNLFGVEYETCCWVARFAAQTNYQTFTTSSASNATTLESDTGLLFQIELKGLAGLGNDIKNLFGSKNYY